MVESQSGTMDYANFYDLGKYGKNVLEPQLINFYKHQITEIFNIAHKQLADLKSKDFQNCPFSEEIGSHAIEKFEKANKDYFPGAQPISFQHKHLHNI